MKTEPPFQFTLRQLLAVTTYVAFTLGLGQWTGSLEVVVHLSLILVGWIMCRVMHGRLGAVIVSLIGLDGMTCAGIDWAYYGREEDFLFFDIRGIFCFLASLMAIVGVGLFFWSAVDQRPYWRTQLTIGLVLSAILIGWWSVVPAIGKAAIAQQQARETAANNAAMAKAVAQVESIRKKLGYIPDKSELNDLLDEPLPCLHWHGCECQIEYERTKTDEYNLKYFYWDFYVYSSANPQKGWYRIPF
jgi:hypothetical protein